MHIPYSSQALDDLIRACIEFTDEFKKYFYASNIAGRSSVIADSDEVKRMMEWVVEFDKGILEYKGFGSDNIEYFRLGHNARSVMTDGGFAKYLSRKRVIERLEQVREWLPIAISLFALVVTFFAWQAPKSSFKRIDELAAQLVVLKVSHGETQSAVVAMQKKLDTNMLPNNRVQPMRKKPRPADAAR